MLGITLRARIRTANLLVG